MSSDERRDRDRRRSDWRFIVAATSALFMPPLMLLLGVWIEQKFSMIDANSKSIDDMQRIMPEILELSSSRSQIDEGLARLKEVELNLKDIRAVQERIEALQRVINVRVDNFAIKQTGIQQRVELHDERLDMIERAR